MFQAALYPLANKDETKREYSKFTGNKDTAAYMILQTTKGSSLPDVIICCKGTWRYKAPSLHHSSVMFNRNQYFASKYAYITFL